MEEYELCLSITKILSQRGLMLVDDTHSNTLSIPEMAHFLYIIRNKKELTLDAMTEKITDVCSDWDTK